MPNIPHCHLRNYQTLNGSPSGAHLQLPHAYSLPSGHTGGAFPASTLDFPLSSACPRVSAKMQKRVADALVLVSSAETAFAGSRLAGSHVFPRSCAAHAFLILACLSPSWARVARGKFILMKGSTTALGKMLDLHETNMYNHKTFFLLSVRIHDFPGQHQ